MLNEGCNEVKPSLATHCVGGDDNRDWHVVRGVREVPGRAERGTSAWRAREAAG